MRGRLPDKFRLVKMPKHRREPLWCVIVIVFPDHERPVHLDHCEPGPEIPSLGILAKLPARDRADDLQSPAGAFEPDRLRWFTVINDDPADSPDISLSCGPSLR